MDKLRNDKKLNRAIRVIETRFDIMDYVEDEKLGEAIDTVIDTVLENIKSKQYKLSELKPCPFCGGEATIVKTWNCNIDPFLIRAFIVGCKKCMITTDAYKSHIFQNEKGEIIVNRTGINEAIKAWNKRAIDG